MTSRARRQAAKEVARTVLRPISVAASCVTERQLLQTFTPESALMLTFGDRLAELRSDFRLRLRALLSYEVVEDEGWQVRTTGYRYELFLPAGEELVAFHWHPRGEGGIAFPHLHVGSPVATATLPPEIPSRLLKGFGKAHVPTGYLAFRDVLRFAIAELGVAPRRPGWRDVLARAEETFPPPSWW